MGWRRIETRSFERLRVVAVRVHVLSNGGEGRTGAVGCEPNGLQPIRCYTVMRSEHIRTII